MTGGPRLRLERAEFPRFLSALRDGGYDVVGPTVADGAIIYGPIRTEEDLPVGWTEVQDAGRYRLQRRPDAALFGYNVGPHSWKRYLFPAHERLWTAQRTDGSFAVRSEPAEERPKAFLGVRACEMAALGVQDRVFLGGSPDPGYRSRRSSALTVAVACGQAARTCFCTSMGTGPALAPGFDLALTELLGPPHRFLLEIGTERGAAVVAGLGLPPAAGSEATAATELVAATARSMTRSMSPVGLRDLLVANPEHPRWDDVARRCLACANCTLACPTCFCSTTEEVPSLDGDRVERWRRWDSCFQSQFTEIHGASVRGSTRSKYRQWLTHKLATWHDQFGESGCVGCGRCITWCPVGIDLTEEVAAIRASTAPEQRR